MNTALYLKAMKYNYFHLQFVWVQQSGISVTQQHLTLPLCTPDLPRLILKPGLMVHIWPNFSRGIIQTGGPTEAVNNITM
jgi:hypothetical protein